VLDNSPIQRLLEVVLPEVGHRYAVVLYEAYFDESGDDGGFPLLALGGYIVRPAAARALERHWSSVLKKYDIPYFHMKECAHEPPSGVLTGMPKERRIALQTELIALINRYVEAAIVCATPLNRFEATDTVVEPYTYCVHNVATLVQSYIEIRHGESYNLSLFYENGHKHGYKAYKYFQEKKDSTRISFSFIDKQSSGMIQAADIIVWQYAKFVKDKALSNRKTRADFRILAQKYGLYCHSFQIKGKILLAFLSSDEVDIPDALILLKQIFSDAEPTDGPLKAFYELAPMDDPPPS